MNMQLIQEVGNKSIKKMPDLKPGSTVRVHQKIKEGDKERVQIFEGLVIAVSPGFGPSKTFTVRKVLQGIGVEKVYPLHSTNITKIQVIKNSDVRRSKLYYMRKRSGKSARLRDKQLLEATGVMTAAEVRQAENKEAEKLQAANVPEAVADTPVVAENTAKEDAKTEAKAE